MLITLNRIIKTGLLNFWRNGWLSTATVLIMTVTLIVWLSLFISNVALTKVIDVLAEKVDISVYFSLSAKEAEIQTLKSRLEGLNEVASVEYVSSQRALEVFKKLHGD